MDALPCDGRDVVIAPTARRLLRYGREISRERGLERFIPYTAHVDPHTVRTKDGDLLQVIELAGLPAETKDASDLDHHKHLRNTLLRSLASSRIALYHHVVRRRVDWPAARDGSCLGGGGPKPGSSVALPPEPESSARLAYRAKPGSSARPAYEESGSPARTVFEDGFAQELDRRWSARWARAHAFENRHYVTVVRRPAPDIARGAKGVARMLRLASDKVDPGQIAARDARERRALEDAVAQVVRSLAPYGARRLGIEPGLKACSGARPGAARSQVLSFLHELLCHERRPVVLPRGGIDEALATKRITFGRDALEVRGAGANDRCIGAMLGVKEYGPSTHAGILDALLRIPHELVLTQSFAFAERPRALQALALQRRQMRNAEDEAVSLETHLADASDAVASGEIAFGEHHLSVLVLARPAPVLGPSETAPAGAVLRPPKAADRSMALGQRLDQAVTAAMAALTDQGILAVREDLNLEPSYFAQLPGNFAFVGRKALVSSANLAGLASLHGEPQGRETGNHWGPCVTRLETTGGAPYAFSFHDPAHGGDLGNFTVIGPSGSGKTVLLSFLVAQAQRFAPRTFFFDKDRGAEIFVRAMGGTYRVLRPGAPTGLNPLLLPDSAENRAFLGDFLGLLLRNADGTGLSPDEREVVHDAVDANFAAPRELRRLLHLQELFRGHDRGGPGSLAARLAPWWGDGDRAWIFDSGDGATRHLEGSGPSASEGPCPSGALQEMASVTGLDLTHLLADPVGCAPVSMFLFHEIERGLDGTPTLIFVDEAWRALGDAMFADRLRDWMKTIRKKNGVVGFGSQSASDALGSPIADTIREQCPTQIFFPNPKASSEAYRGGFGLSARELELVRTLPGTARAFLLRQGETSLVAKLDLSDPPGTRAEDSLEALLPVLSGRAESVLRVDRLREELGDAPALWLDRFLAESPAPGGGRPR